MCDRQVQVKKHKCYEFITANVRSVRVIEKTVLLPARDLV